MAESQILLNSNLQITPGLCENCLHPETFGKNQGVNGSFTEFLNNSLKQGINTNSGQVLPDDGNSLPQVTLPNVLNEYRFKLKSLANELQFSDIDVNIIAESLGESLEEAISTGDGLNLVDLQLQLDQLPVTESQLQAVLNQTDLSDIIQSIQNIIPQTSQNANELIAKLFDGQVNPSNPPVQTNNISLKPAQADSNNSIAKLLNYQQNIVADSLPKDIEKLNNIAESIQAEHDEPAIYAKDLKLDARENKADKLNDLMATIFSENNINRTISKHSAINTEVFQQNISAIKSDPVTQNININTGVDTYNQLNTIGLNSKSIESPIPLLIKQGVGLDQVQKSVDQSITQNIKWLINNSTQNAKINVYPESLGQVNIALSLEDSNLKINFLASSNITKELIETSVTNLRNHFHESGINLEEVNVETHFSSQTDQSSQFSDLSDKAKANINEHSSFTAQEDDIAALHNTSEITSSLYLLDAYA